MSSKTIIGAGLLALMALCIWCVLRHYPYSGTMVGEAPTATLDAKLLGGKVTLNGTAPDQATKDQLIARANSLYGQGNYLDNLKIGGTSANADWLKGALGLLPFAVRGGTGGGVSINGTAATLSGQVPNAEIRQQLMSLATNAAGKLTLTDGLTISGATLSPPLIAGLLNGKVTLDGTAPDQAAKTGILSRATELFGAGNIINQLKLAAPGSVFSFGSNWLNTVLGSLGLLGRFGTKGEINFNGQTLTLNGEVPTLDVKNKLIQDVTNLVGPGVSIIDQITVTETLLNEAEAKVQTDLKQQLLGKTIEFDTNSDKITPVGAAILDQIAPILAASPAANIEISGHTDSRGTDKLNQPLSQRRSISVEKYLIGKSITGDRMTPRGYGSAQPIGDNSTEEGQARNRRIEFRVVPGKAPAATPK